jgi:isoleucyl-tRNA synthetase
MSKSSEIEAPAQDYRASLFLPATDFPMKAGLPEAEPKWLQRWAEMDLYGKMRERARGRPLFILHDGPIYANGDIHSGTGLNHILKDFVVRSQGMLGKDAPYVPGWDCHGLPIEWKVEEQYRAEGRSKDEVPTDQLRRDCRVFASHWLKVQRGQIQRLGQIGDFERPYTTMNFRAEAVIAREAMKFVENGLLYRGFRPVMWSPVEKTALADAEVEYHEKSSPAIYVKFPVLDGELKGAFVVIWTTTPWTIPGNRAIAYSPDISYGLYEIADAADGALARAGERILLADALAETAAKDARMMLSRLRTVEKPELASLVASHPLRGLGYEFEVPLLAGSHVTADAGTGFVHTAPGHGEDDFELLTSTYPGYAAKNPDAFSLVEPDGSFGPKVPHFAGKRILTAEGKDGEANGAVIRTLIEQGMLLAKGTLRHSYPHSWRSKAPVIFRATPQWFVAIDKTMPGFADRTLREMALQAIADTRWYPPRGQNRIGSMVETRPDWVLSRQRAWGVPLAIFVEKKTGRVLNDPAVFARIVAAFEAEGADAWFTSTPERFLGEGYKPDDYEQVKDILDVWFDSGSTHVFTVENPIDPHWPKADQADLYLEGSDQHRGWFQSSLLESVGTSGRAPYKGVLTHGFVLDDQGRKMSKSLGNTLAPQVIAEKYGAEILRLWAASSDFTEDLRIGPDILKANVEAYRRLRNTIRFLLANLAGFSEAERVGLDQMPELERFMLARLVELGAQVRDGYAGFDFNRVTATLFNFCTNELSAFYFDIRKDVLYCDAARALRRRATRTVMDEIFRRVVTWFAPVLCFTMEEAWTSRFPEAESVHLEIFFDTPPAWSNPGLVEKWKRIRSFRRVVTGALEIERAAKTIGSSLEACPIAYFDPKDWPELDQFPARDVAITSQFELRRLSKCARCWMVMPEVGTHKDHPDLCDRCEAAVTQTAPAGPA